MNSAIAMGVRGPEFENPTNALARIMQVQGMQQESAMRRMQMEEYQRGAAEQNALRTLMADPSNYKDGAFDVAGAAPKLYAAAPSKAAGVIKGFADQRKADADHRTALLTEMAKRAELTGQAFGGVVRNPTLEGVHSALDHLGSIGVFDAARVSQLKAQAGTPEAAASLAQNLYRMSLSAKDQLPRFMQQDNGGSNAIVSIDPLSGVHSVVSSTQKTATPGEVLTDSRGRATLAEQSRHNRTMEGYRGQEVSAPKGVLDPERGLLVDPRTGEARPVTMGGQPVGAKPPAEARKELMSINQQRAAIGGAIEAAEKSPSAFSYWRGLAASLPGGETIAGRFESMDETQARAYVFNNVSRIINERAGAAQSAQELARLQQFLPGASDNQTQIVNKLKGFNKYLDDLERGTTTPAGSRPTGPTAGASDSDPLGLRR